MDDIQAFVGIDWGTETHRVCVMAPSRKVLWEASVAHRGEALVELAQKLLRLTETRAEQIAVAIEVPRGTVVETLLEKGIQVFAINPKQLDRFRDRHTAAGAKDDRRDAFVLADSLRTDMPAFRRLRMGEAHLVQLRELSRMYDELKAERIALGSRLREQLHRYFQQILELGSVYDDPWIWALLERASTPEQAKRLSLAKIGSILKSHRIRRLSPEEVRTTLRREPLHVAPGVVEACRRHVELLLARLRLVHEQKCEVEKAIGTLIDGLAAEGKAEHRDALILQSLQGLGKLVCATMLAEAWEPLRARDHNTLRALSGTAPITKQSGKQRAVLMRHACNHRLREAVHYWSRSAAANDPFWKARYASLRAAGHAHARALRGIADRLLSVLIGMLRSNTTYDPTRRSIPAPSTSSKALPAV